MATATLLAPDEEVDTLLAPDEGVVAFAEIRLDPDNEAVATVDIQVVQDEEVVQLHPRLHLDDLAIIVNHLDSDDKHFASVEICLVLEDAVSDLKLS